MSEEFYYVFIDNQSHTMQEIGDLTGNSICTIRRHTLIDRIEVVNRLIQNTLFFIKNLQIIMEE